MLPLVSHSITSTMVLCPKHCLILEEGELTS
jgi:hypothetical protein